jgi:hypothetical protein
MKMPSAFALLLLLSGATLAASGAADFYFVGVGLGDATLIEVRGLRPRVAILSLGPLGHKAGGPKAMQAVRSSPGLEDFWQAQKIVDDGEKGHNSADDFIANIGGRNERAQFIRLSASADGGFKMTNSRNGFTKKYPPRKQTGEPPEKP